MLLIAGAVRMSVRTGLPSLLLYLAIGLAIGEAGLGIRFDDFDRPAARHRADLQWF